MRSIFGWSYPPGAAGDPNAPWNQTDDGPCYVCGQQLDDCVCPECPICGEVGNPRCYDGALDCSWCGSTTRDRQAHCLTCASNPDIERTFSDVHHHGLVRSFAQVALLAEFERIQAEEDAKEAAYWDEAAREEEEALRQDRIAEELEAARHALLGDPNVRIGASVLRDFNEEQGR